MVSSDGGSYLSFLNGLDQYSFPEHLLFTFFYCGWFISLRQCVSGHVGFSCYVVHGELVVL
jgi:hypothetical protein